MDGLLFDVFLVGGCVVAASGAVFLAAGIFSAIYDAFDPRHK